MRYLSILCMTCCLTIHAQRNTEPMEPHTPQDLMAQADNQRNTGWITMGAGAVGALAVAATGKMDSPRETAIVCGIFAAGCTFTLAFRASANAKDRQAMREMAANELTPR